MAKVRWVNTKNCWQLDKMYQGKRKSFYSHEKSERKAQADCNRQFFNWVDANEEKSTLLWGDAWAEHLKDYSERNKPTSTHTLSQRGKTYFLPVLEKRILTDVRKQDYQMILDKHYEDKGLARDTLKKLASTITVFCRFCASKGYINDSDIPQNFFIPANASVGVRRSLYPQEFKQLFSNEVDNFSWYIPMFRFLVATGLRRGELCALQTERDLDIPYINIRSNLSGILIEVSPKNGKTRTEFLNKHAIEALKQHNKNRKEKGFTSPYVFCSSTGKRINPKIISENWRKYRKKYGLGEIKLHELRHTYATFAKKKLTLEELQLMLGHSKSMDTMGTYVHEIPLTTEEKELQMAIDKEIADKVSEVFSFIFDTELDNH